MHVLRWMAGAVLAAATTANAQGSISGRVLADPTRAPVAGAEIILRGTTRVASSRARHYHAG